MRKVAVTGGLASGKTTVCHLLKERGAYVVDADALQFKVLMPEFSTPKFWLGTVPPPATVVNVKPLCESTIVCGSALTVMVTGTRIRWFKVSLKMLMVPE